MSFTKPGTLSTLNNVTTTEVVFSSASFLSLPHFQLAVSLWAYGYPVLFILGTFGNVMSIVIMRRLMAKESTVNLFFMALAVGDLLALYSGPIIMRINIAFGVSVIDQWPGLYFPALCVYLSAGGYVSWILVCMTLQRALSVAWPHHVSHVFTRGRVIKVIVGIAVFQFCLYSHHLCCVYVTLTTSLTGSQCIALPSFPYAWFLANVFIYIAMFLTSVLPFVCLVVGNGVLVFSLVTSVRQSLKKTVHLQVGVKRRTETKSVTVTIIAVSLAFIVLTLPLFIYGVLFQFKDPSTMSDEEQALVFLIYTVFSLMGTGNNAVNFYIYCLTGRRFRQEFVNRFLCRPARDVS